MSFRGLAVLEWLVAVGCVPICAAGQFYPELFAPEYFSGCGDNDIPAESGHCQRR